MDRRNVLKLGAVGLITLPNAGCATLLNLIRTGLREPNIRVTRMTLKDVMLDAVTMVFDMELTNPNPIGFSLAGLGYALEVEGSQLASGRVDEQLNVKAQGKSNLRFPVSFALGRTSQAIMQLLKLDEAAYAIDTDWKLGFKGTKQIKGGTITVPFRHDGRFPVPKLPVVEFPTVRFTSVGPGGLGMRVSSRVKNPNKFQLPVDDFKFDFKLNGNSVLRNKKVEGLDIAAGRTKTVNVDFTFGLVEAGLTLASLVQKPTLDWKVNMDLESGKVTAPFKGDGRIRLA